MPQLGEVVVRNQKQLHEADVFLGFISAAPIAYRRLGSVEK